MAWNGPQIRQAHIWRVAYSLEQQEIIIPSTHDHAETAVCTIISKNYLAFARTLMNSVAAAHPTWKRYLLLVDDVDDRFDPGAENFETVHVSELPLPDSKKFLFRYTVLELNTAVKPWFLQWLFERTSAERVIYLDPDIRVYAPLTEVERLLAGGALMTLTPHLLAELNDDRHPSDRDILRAGCYNLGFLALSRHRELPRFLTWWQNKLTYDCRIDLHEGLFVDQKWIDLVPGLFSDVVILRHPGYNVAYWNLAHRPVRVESGDPKVGSDPLVFFHFSGLDPLAPAAFSKHQNRYLLKNLGVCATLVTDYCQEVLENGWKTCKNWPYAFGTLADGTTIHTGMRHYYRAHPAIIRRVGSDPFRHKHEYLNESVDQARQPLITRLMHAVWENRQDLRDAFPDISGAFREAFIDHFIEFGARQEGIPEVFVQPVRDSLLAWRASRHSSGQSESALRICDPTVGIDADHPATSIIRGLARAVLTVVPLPRSPERLRQYYRLTQPIWFLLPAEVRNQLKRDMLCWVARKSTASTSSWRLIEGIRSLGAWVRHFLWFGGSTTKTHAASPTPPHEIVGDDVTTRSHELPQTNGELPATGNGLNIVGYFEAATGVGESSRLCVQASTAAGLPFSVHDITPDTARTSPDPRWASYLTGHNSHAVNLLHVNADQTAIVRESLGTSFFASRYNIGFWHWELPRFPDRWLAAFDDVDEIWVPSRFIQDAVAARSPRPVIRIPHAIRFTANTQAARRDFGLPNDDVLFLMMYDVQSFQSRKNPEGAIEAFRRAFGGARGVSLVIKVNDSLRRTEEANRLGTLLQRVPNVKVLDERLDRQRTYDLQSLCDCTVSLHRAEGFGLVLAESMFLGKPVIATAWSGNMEFMTPQNSCPVDYRLVRLDRDVGPYERDQVWAEPDLDHAAELMKKVASDTSWARRISDAGRTTITDEFSPERIGELYRQRLDAILRLRSPMSRAGRFAA